MKYSPAPITRFRFSLLLFTIAASAFWNFASVGVAQQEPVELGQDRKKVILWPNAVVFGDEREAEVDLGRIGCSVETTVEFQVAGPLAFAKVHGNCKCREIECDSDSIKANSFANARFSFKTPVSSKQSNQHVEFEFLNSNKETVARLKFLYELEGNLSFDRADLTMSMLEGIDDHCISKIPFSYSEPVSKQNLICEVIGSESISADLSYSKHSNDGFVVITANVSNSQKTSYAVVRLCDRANDAVRELSVKVRQISPVSTHPRLLRLGWSEEKDEYQGQMLIASKMGFENDKEHQLTLDGKDVSMTLRPSSSAELRWALVKLKKEQLNGNTSGVFELLVNHGEGRTSINVKWALASD